MSTITERLRWIIWRRWPRRMPAALRCRILELAPYRCEQIGQGNPMIVMRREVWEAGGYEEVPGAPFNLDGEDWIIRQWLRAHPDWRP